MARSAGPSLCEQAMSRPYLLHKTSCVKLIIVPLRPSPVLREGGTVDMELWFVEATFFQVARRVFAYLYLCLTFNIVPKEVFL